MNATALNVSAQTPPITHRLMRAALGMAGGLLAGLIYGALLGSQQISPMMNPTDLPGDTIFHLLLSVLAGAVFGLTLGEQAITAGQSLVWGIVFGIVWWLIGPLTLFPLLHAAPIDWSIATARSAFPLLMGLAVAFGALLGLLYWALSGLAAHWRDLRLARQSLLSLAMTACSGALAGLLGGWVFGAWMEQADFFPLVAGLLNSNDTAAGRSLHFLISVVIGISYSALFQRDTRTVGASVAWGMVYGLIWWILGPLTLMPWLLGQGVQWSLTAAQSVFPSLIGHLLYGVTLGIAQAILSQIWRTLFVDSDPLRREPEGPGTRSLRALSLGALASVVGGLVFTVVMVATDALPGIAGLMGMSGAVEGFIVHMIISVIIGMAYGLLFRRETSSAYTALAWGVVYGVVWWVLGPLTLMPLLLGFPFQWSLEAAAGAFPSLIGHILYGAALALAYDRLLRRYDPRRAQTAQTESDPVSSAAPALWVLVLLLSQLVLLLQP